MNQENIQVEKLTVKELESLILSGLNNLIKKEALEEYWTRAFISGQENIQESMNW